MAIYVKRFALATLFLIAPTLFAATLSLVEPRDHAVLQGGSLATITWTATGPLPEGAEEWEAFLSVDGGRYYADRITPHLDIDIRSFQWRVPNVSSKEVRLLIRVGDERSESVFELEPRFSIEATEELEPPFVTLPKSRAEAARPGDPPVVEWANGDRRGKWVVDERAPVPQELVSIAIVERVPAAHAVPSRVVSTRRATKPAAARFSIAIRSARTVSRLQDGEILDLVCRLNI